MNKKNFKKNILIDATLLISIFFLVFCIYTSFYYKNINVNTLETQFIICSNIIFDFISTVLNMAFTSILDKDNIKVIIVVTSIIIVIYELDLKSLLRRISNIEFEGFKMQIDSKKVLENINNQTEKKVKQLKDKKNQDNQDDKSEIETELECTTKKMKLIKIFSKDPFLLDILDRFISKRVFSVSIPFYVLKEKTSIESIRKIFDYKITEQTVKIIKIKDDIKDLVYDLYFEIQKESK